MQSTYSQHWWELSTLEKSAKLLGINFDEHVPVHIVPSPCKKAISNQFNIINKLHRYLGFKEKEVLVSSFIYANFNYCPLIWHYWRRRSINNWWSYKLLKGRIHCEMFLSEDFMKYSFRVISWNIRYFHEILLL